VRNAHGRTCASELTDLLGHTAKVLQRDVSARAVACHNELQKNRLGIVCRYAALDQREQTRVVRLEVTNVRWWALRSNEAGATDLSE
jgi:hypothetical protein